MPDNYDLMQNPALGCCCIGQFVRSYFNVNECGPTLPLLISVLPITFHERTVEILHRRSLQGGLLNAKAEFKDLGVGLQERMEQMFDQSMSSIAFGIYLGVFELDPSTCLVSPTIKKLPSDKFPPATRKMLWTADRLGRWMGVGPLEMVCSHLKIVF
ncbi:MAG: three component ABC system middle component [Fimbriimonadaceae bacterium]